MKHEWKNIVLFKYTPSLCFKKEIVKINEKGYILS